MSNKVVRIGVVGCGGMGMDHIHYLLKAGGYEVVALCDLDAANLRKAAALVTDAGAKEPQSFTDYDALLKSGLCEALCLAMPIPLNAEFAWRGLEAGHHVFGEKPLATCLKDAARLKKAIDASGKLYQVGFELRHSPLLQSLKQTIDRGDIGQVCGVTYSYARKANHAARKWAFAGEGGSVLFDCLSHSFDLVNLLMGAKMSSVFAFAGKSSALVPDDPDLGAVAFEYDSGARGTLFFCEFCGQGFNTLFEVYGDDGKILVNPADAGSYTMYWGKSKHETSVTINPESTCPGHLGIDEEHVEFRDAVLANRSPYSDFAVGLDSLFLSVGATRSARGGRPVPRAELEAEFQHELAALE